MGDETRGQLEESYEIHPHFLFRWDPSQEPTSCSTRKAW